MRVLGVLSLCLMMLSLASLSAAAQEEKSVSEQIQELREKIERLEAENERINMKMYERQAEERKAWYSKTEAKTRKGTGLTFQTADKNYRLRMRLRGQFLANFVDPEGPDNSGFGFRVRRLRATWDGNAFAPWMKYKIQYDFSRNGELKDLRLAFARNRSFVPVVGQYKVPFNRERLNSSSALQVVGRSILNDYFDFDRDIGAGLYGLFADGRIRYDLGAFQGEGTNVKNDSKDTGMLWAGRVQASVIGGSAGKVKENFARRPTLMVGAAVAGIDIEKEGADANMGIPSGERKLDGGRVTSFTADLNYRDPRFNLTGEYVGRWVNPDAGGEATAFDQGFRVQGGFFVLPKTVELASRYALVMFDGDVANEESLDKVWTFTQGLNYYLSGDHRWKLQLDYTFQREGMTDGGKADEQLIRAQVQIYF